MVKSSDDMIKMGASMAQTTNAAALTALEGLRRLADVNLQAARSSLEQSAEQINALLAAKDVNTLTQLAASFTQPSPEKFTAYAQAVATIARDTQSNLADLVREQISRSNEQLEEALQSLARSAPTGSEGAMSFIRQAMASASASYEQFNQSMQRMMNVEAAAAPAAEKPAKRSR